MNTNKMTKENATLRAERSPQTYSQPQKGTPMSTSAPASAVQSGPRFRMGDTTSYKAWVAKATKQPLALETVELGPLGTEEVEVAVEHCGLCHSDLSVLNKDRKS